MLLAAWVWLGSPSLPGGAAADARLHPRTQASPGGVVLLTARNATSDVDTVYGVEIDTGRIGILRQPAADEPRLNAQGTELAARTWFTRLTVVGLGGKVTSIQVPVPAGVGPTPPFWSPDGRYIALLTGFAASPSEAEPPADLLMVLVPSTRQLLTVLANHRTLGLVRWMQWTPADQLLFSAGGHLYGVTRPTAPNTVNYVRMALATGPMGDGGRFSLSPDGRLVAWIRDGHVWIGGLSGIPAPHSLTGGATIDTDPVFSPDGRFVAFIAGVPHRRRTVWMVSVSSGAIWPLRVTRPVPRGLALDGASPLGVTEVDQWYSGGNAPRWLGQLSRARS